MIDNPGFGNTHIFKKRVTSDEFNLIKDGWDAAFKWLETKQSLQDAMSECHTYAVIGGLTNDMIEDIAAKYEVDYKDILREMDWDE